MTTITLNINNEVNTEFRNLVKLKFGEGKGKLGKAVEDAIKKWMFEQKQKLISERQIQIMRQGVWSNRGFKFNREEIYDRK